MEAPTTVLRLSDKPSERSGLCQFRVYETAVRSRPNHHVASEKFLPLKHNPNGDDASITQFTR